MARRNRRNDDGPGFFEEHERQLARQVRRQRALFIPHFLREAASHAHLRGEAQDRAYQIAVHWADLETSGHLPEYKETSIDTQFLDQLFGDGLGFKLKSKSPSEWQLEHKFFVPGVGTADAAIGDFPNAPVPTAVVELKDAGTDLDRTRFNGRTAVRQCWDYLNALPDCPWGIVSNFSIIRLYSREKGSLSYEEFTLQELRDRQRFNDFYCIFERGGLLKSLTGQQPRALTLLRKTVTRQREVGEDLYKSYQAQRLRLIEHLMSRDKKELDEAIRIAQKLLDRIIFIAFCEKRGLLNEDCIALAARETPDAFGERNPRWKKFLGLFREVDKGGKRVGVEPGYNGGLFAPDPAIDGLELDDIPWTHGFRHISQYDYSEEVSVEVLGHIFERSVTELEKLRVGGLYALKSSLESANGNGNGVAPPPKTRTRRPRTPEPPVSRMPKSAQRKRFGIYYTPPAFTGLIVERTVDVVVREQFIALAKKHQVDPEARKDQASKKLLAYWTDCLDALKKVTVCDPACGSGAFLIRAYEALDAHYKTVIHGLAGAGLPAAEVVKFEDAVPDWILNHNLYGVDLSHEAVEITQLALWIRSARRGKKLSDLSQNILCGNSLVSDKSVDPKALDWHLAFPAIFASGGPGGFSCVIGNPPWERVKLEEREFFGLSAPEIAMAANAADRRKMIERLPENNPELSERYDAAQRNADRILRYVRTAEAGFPLTGKGDVNYYMLFAELARRIVAPTGYVGLLLPSGIATDHTTKEFFGELVASKSLSAIYDFVNRFGLFPDVEGRLKFCILLFTGSASQTEHMGFVFWAERIEDLADKSRHVAMSARDIRTINPNTLTCPIFRTQRDADLTKAIYRRIPILIDKRRKQGGNPWGIKFFTMFHQTNDAEHFHEAKSWERRGFRLDRNNYVKGKERAFPLLEAKMTRDYDHRASRVSLNPRNRYMNYSAEPVSLVEHQNPEFLPAGRYWVSGEEISMRAPESLSVAAIGFHDIARANDTRTMVACFVPYAACSNKLPLVVNDTELGWRLFTCVLGNLNSYIYDFVVRQKVGGANLNFFIVEQLPTLPPDAYAEKCPWSKKETLEHWISERVLKLSCTAEDMIPLARACGFKGSRGDGVHMWKEAERAELRAELDAAYFLLYQIERDDVEYILSTFTNTGLAPADQRGEQQHLWNPGSTGAMILAAYDRLRG